MKRVFISICTVHSEMKIQLQYCKTHLPENLSTRRFVPKLAAHETQNDFLWLI